MGKLAEYLKSEAEQLRAEEGARKRAITEWQTAIRQLFGQLKEWLQSADEGENLLLIDDESTLLREPRLGLYESRYLTIGLRGGATSAQVAPKARYVIASIKPPGRESRRADGMVSIGEGSNPTYYLFRWKTDSGDEWFIQSVANWGRPDRFEEVEPLDRDRFEAAILRVLT